MSQSWIIFIQEESGQREQDDEIKRRDLATKFQVN
jgi:hypothetical protein